VKLLAIESSCDDTAAAVLVDGVVRSNVVASQDGVHHEYGGVVPELASRSHVRALVPTIERALAGAAVTLGEVDAVAATHGPGLIGSLLVGLSAAKAIAYARGIPFVGVNHIEGHLVSAFLDRPAAFPYVALIVSGGHSALYLARDFGHYATLGNTRDDAAGEAFDKVAKMLGLGYPGGRIVDELAAGGDPEAIRFPRARLKPSAAGRRFDFSFSGLKTAVWLHLREHGADRGRWPDIAASFQEAVVEMLLTNAFAAVQSSGVDRLVIAGGVSANSRLRRRAEDAGRDLGVEVMIPALRYCTDNAAMVGLAAYHRLVGGQRDPLTLNAAASLELDR
jgi:tRNA N6-adenosine threonylcarbamoyltransferase